MYQGRHLHVAVTHESATYSLRSGDAMELAHHGERFTLSAGSVTKPIPEGITLERPQQPPGREPPIKR
jgi:alpha,alpha-trehalose phosphorylase